MPSKKPSRLIVPAAIFLCLGVGLILEGYLVPDFLDGLISDKVNEYLIIDSPNAPGYAAWQDTRNASQPTYTQFYLFDIVNPAEVLEGQKPALEERGPYYYKTEKVRFNVSWTSDQAVKYKEWTWYEFDPLQSYPLQEDDEITTLNYPFFALKSSLYDKGHISTEELELIYIDYDDPKRMFMRRSVKEIIFGFVDPKFDAIHKVVPDFSGFTDLVPNYTLTNATELTRPNRVSMQDPSAANFRGFESYNGEKYLTACFGVSLEACEEEEIFPAWGSKEANTIRGTDGSQFHRNIDKGSHLWIWVNFRHINLVNKDDLAVTFEGIDLLRFRIPDRTWFSTKHEEANRPYFNNWADGMWNLSHVSRNVETFVTKPHFLDLDPNVANTVTGLYPDRDAHSSFIDVEPYSGTSMRVAIRLQINLRIAPMRHLPPLNLTWFDNVSPALVPIFWSDSGGAISEENAETFRRGVYGLMKVASYARYIGYIGGGGMFAAWLIILTIAYFQARHNCLPSVNSAPLTDKDDKYLKKRRRKSGLNVSRSRIRRIRRPIRAIGSKTKPKSNASSQSPLLKSGGNASRCSPIRSSLYVHSPKSPENRNASISNQRSRQHPMSPRKTHSSSQSTTSSTIAAHRASLTEDQSGLETPLNNSSGNVPHTYSSISASSDSSYSSSPVLWRSMANCMTSSHDRRGEI